MTGPSTQAEIGPLRTEIVEAQRSRTDLMKYKLVVTAALGAVALGVGPAAGTRQVPYVVGIIPLVCLYVDAVCHHNDIRIMVIGRYLRSEGLHGYETLAQELREKFNLERVALEWSSLAISIGLVAFGMLYGALSRAPVDRTLVWITMVSGTMGGILTLQLGRAHRLSMRQVSTMTFDS